MDRKTKSNSPLARKATTLPRSTTCCQRHSDKPKKNNTRRITLAIEASIDEKQNPQNESRPTTEEGKGTRTKSAKNKKGNKYERWSIMTTI